MVGNNTEVEKNLWEVANQLRANSGLKSSEYADPVLGMIFLRHADFIFEKVDKHLKKSIGRNSRREISKHDYQATGAIFLPEGTRFSDLLNLAEGEDIGAAINEAMTLIENENGELKDVLPKNYEELSDDLLVALLRLFSEGFQIDQKGDVFGKIYEYFLGKFAMMEGRRGGEFFTPPSLVITIVEVNEPYHGKILDNGCGAGGMFVHSAKFVKEHKKNPSSEISIYGQEKTADTVNLCKMNLAINGLSGIIKQGNTYYEDVHDSIGKFDFVMANPPFNVHGVDYKKLKGDPRWVFGFPSTDNANYIWIQAFYSALNEKGRAGFVMANSASDARGNELEIRKKLIKNNIVDVMIAIGPNFFYTVTLPCTLWFFDKDKKNTERKDKILFIDAKNIYTQVDRAHREFTSEQIDKIAGIVRSYRNEGGAEPYKDVKGLCKVATIKEIEKHGWSLNPGGYVGVDEKKKDDFDFKERLGELNQELEELNVEAKELEGNISENVKSLISGN